MAKHKPKEPTQHPANKERSDRARGALDAYWGEYTLSDPDVETAVQDLLCDLRHLCDTHGFCLGDLDKQAHACYLEELETPDL